MIFSTLIAFLFGFLMVALGLILEAKVGAIVAGLLVGAFGFLGSQRLAHGQQSVARLIAGGVCSVLPVWLVPLWAGSDWQFQNFWPALIIVTVAVAAGIVFTAHRERSQHQR